MRTPKRRPLAIILLLLAVALGALAASLYTPDKPRSTLEATYLASPADYREIAGIRLHVRDTGPPNTPPANDPGTNTLILLHGFGASLHTWDPWAARLAPAYRVIRYDLPGFGLTGPDPTGDYADRRSIEVLLALMDALAIPRATLVGNSMGGRLAWQFAAEHPSRVDRLVLISPDGFASPGFEYGKAPDIPPMLRLLPYVLPTALLRGSLAPAYANPAALTDARLTRYRDLLLAPGVRQAIIARTAQTIRQDPTPALRTIQAPTLILWGENDRMIPLANAADYAAAIPHATLVTLPALGHVPFEESPETALAPLLDFLSRTPRP